MDSVSVPTTGPGLRALRQRTGISVKALAMSLGHRPSYVAEVESRAQVSRTAAIKFVDGLRRTEPDVVRLDSLAPAQRRVIAALLVAESVAMTAVRSGRSETAEEVRDDGADDRRPA